MKSIIVYYSLEGNCAYAAEKIAEKLGSDILRIEPVKPFPTKGFKKFFIGGMSVVRGAKPHLKPYQFNQDEYDLIIAGSPVWAGSYASPMKTFFSENDLCGKRAAVFACSSGGDGEKCLDRLASEFGKESVIADLSLMDPKLNRDAEADEKIQAFCDQIKGEGKK